MIYIVGAGPSGTMLAYALQQLAPNIPVSLVDEHHAKWHCTYGCFYEHLRDTWLEQIVTKSRMVKYGFDKIHVRFPQGEKQVTLEYCILNNKSIQKSLRRKLKQVKFIKKRFTPDNTAQFWVDCRGRTVNDVDNLPDFYGYQQFVGIKVKLKNRVPKHLNRAVLMDWSDSNTKGPPTFCYRNTKGPPTFCYSFPTGKRTVFMEETCLCNRKLFPYELLERRIHKRLEKLGIRPQSTRVVERHAIVMGGSKPDWIQGKRFGAASGMVHRITGYMFSHVVNKCFDAARAVLARYRGHRVPRFNSRLNWFYRFGQRGLMNMSLEELQYFFNEFFTLPHDFIFRFMTQQITLPELMRSTLPMLVKLKMLRLVSQKFLIDKR
jgi:lycopene cyclase-like protein